VDAYALLPEPGRGGGGGGGDDGPFETRIFTRENDSQAWKRVNE